MRHAVYFMMPTLTETFDMSMQVEEIFSQS